MPELAAAAWRVALPTDTVAKVWRGIVPLESTRADVIKLLGEPRSTGGYDLGDQFVVIHYSSGDCTAEIHCECLVGPDVVTEIEVTIKTELPLNQLNLDLSSFKKSRDSHLLVYDYYTNRKEGVTYTVFREEARVTVITYYPSEKDCKRLLRRKKS